MSNALRAILMGAAVACAMTAVACSGSSSGGSSGSSSPSSPSGSGGSGGTSSTCRTYPTAATVTTTALGITTTLNLTGAFNASTSQATITTLLPNGTPCTTSVSTYRSTSDFVDEVRVIPGLTMPTGTTTTNGAGCGGPLTSTVTYTYDAQRRLTSFSSNGIPTTYTAWDSDGRPTAGSFPGTSISNTYNNTARTWVSTQTTGATVATSTTTYDANGNQLTVVATIAGLTTNTTFNTTSTAQVCK